MSSLKDNFWKQHKIGQTWGRFALAGSQITVFMSAYTVVMVTVGAYVPIKGWLLGRGIDIPFWGFIGIVIIPILVAFILSWKFLVASYYRTSVEQFWKQGKEWTERIEKIDNLQKDLNKIKQHLGIKD